MEKTKQFYIEHLEKSFQNAEAGKSKVAVEILEMLGMTGRKTRHLYNNILDFEDSRYLEIGTWAGSSVCAAMCKNKSTVVCIDNWSEFNGQDAKEVFFIYFNEFKGDNNATFIEGDCFKIDVNDLAKFNVYLYDGGHTYEDHFKALSYYLNCLDDIFIYIVDDWNWDQVRKGTNDAIKHWDLEILWKKEIILTENNEHTPLPEAGPNWWNGIAVYLLKKKAVH